MDAERLDIEKALAYLTLEEKVRILSGDGMWHTFGVGELPSVRMSDGPTGLRMTDGVASSAVPATCYPTPAMLANSFDPALLYSVGAAIGKEATAMGVNLLLAPGVNIKRHPLGGRNFEYFSEDPLLAGELAKAYISGVQSTGVGACIKHFAANNQEYMRMYSDSTVDPRALHEIYLKPFETAFAAQPAAVMCAYNKLNGAYCAQNKQLLTDILRDELKYDGVVISDWGAVHDRADALKAGLDLAMPDSNGLFERQIMDALDSGKITETDINKSVARILELVDNVYLEPYGDYDVDSHDRIAYNAAAASIVLLKNENGFLPLTKNMRVAVCGELADIAPIQGGGSSHVTAIKSISPLTAFATRAIDISYCHGYSSVDKKHGDAMLREAIETTDGCDAVIVFVGQPAPHEGVDRTTLALPKEQNRLISELTAAGRKVVVVVCSAGPVLMPWINRVYAVVYAGLNGQCGGLAAVDTLYGRINPCAKLAETFPIADNDCGFTLGEQNPQYRESIFVGYRYYDAAQKRVLFPFGHGLSFSSVSYDGIQAKRVGDNEFDVTVTLTNKSVRDTYEIVQLYASDCTGRIMCAKKQLVGFQKVFVEGQTTSTAVIRITKRAFEFFNTEKNAFDISDGEYLLLAGPSSTVLNQKITVKVNGGFTDRTPIPPECTELAYGKITETAFKTLFGQIRHEKSPAQQSEEFTLDCCIDDIKKTFAGRIAKHMALKHIKNIGSAGSPERDAYYAFAMFTPLSAMSAMSSGAFSLSKAKGIVEMANGNFFKGLKLIFKK